MNRLLFLIIFQLTVVATSFASTVDRNKVTFSDPQSIFLFSGERGDLLIATSVGNLQLSRPQGATLERSFPLPALAPLGDQVAASFRVPDEPEDTICNRLRPVTGPHKSTSYKSVLGVYSLRDKRWKLYGDFCFVGSAVFSPDGSKVAFKVTTRSDDQRFISLPSPDVLLMLDLGTGQMTPVPETANVIGNRQLSWSPDGQYLAVSQTSRMEKTPGVIVLIQVGSWIKKDIAVGENPSWSPKGDWIAYQADWSRSCVIVHPDGTGSRTVLDLRGRPGGWLLYDWIGWSADEDRLLVNEEQFDGPGSEVTMLNLASGQTTTKSKGGVPVLGWTAMRSGGSDLIGPK